MRARSGLAKLVRRTSQRILGDDYGRADGRCRLGPEGLVLVNVSGRGDKDIDQVRRMLEPAARPVQKKRARKPAPRRGGSRR